MLSSRPGSPISNGEIKNLTEDRKSSEVIIPAVRDTRILHAIYVLENASDYSIEVV